MKQQSAGSWHYRTVGHDDLLLAVFRPAYRPGTQPPGRSYFFDKANGLASEQRRRNRLHPLGVGDAPTRRRFVENKAETQVARSRDRRDATGNFSDRTGQGVAAAVATEQGHCNGAILGNRDNRRLFKFGSEQRCHRADQDAAGAYADNRASSFE